MLFFATALLFPSAAFCALPTPVNFKSISNVIVEAPTEFHAILNTIGGEFIGPVELEHYIQNTLANPFTLQADYPSLAVLYKLNERHLLDVPIRNRLRNIIWEILELAVIAHARGTRDSNMRSLIDKLVTIQEQVYPGKITFSDHVTDVVCQLRDAEMKRRFSTIHCEDYDGDFFGQVSTQDPLKYSEYGSNCLLNFMPIGYARDAFVDPEYVCGKAFFEIPYKLTFTSSDVLQCEKCSDSTSIFLISKNNNVQELTDGQIAFIKEGDLIIFGSPNVLANAPLTANLLVNEDDQVRAWRMKAAFPTCNVVLLRPLGFPENGKAC